MIAPRAVMAVLLATGALGATEAWVVPAHPAPLVVEAQGFVVANRSRECQLESPGRELVLRDMLPAGSRVVRGQRVIRFDTSAVEADLPVRARDLDITEAQVRRQVLEAEGWIAGIEARRVSLRAELAAAVATLATFGRDQANAVAAGEVRIAQAVLAETAVRRSLEDAEIRVQAGDLPADKRDEILHRLRLAALDRQEATLITDAARLGTPTRRTALLRRIQEFKHRLGLRPGPDGQDQPDPGAGIEQELGWATSNLERVKSGARSQREGARLSLQEARRNAADCVPLAWMTATPVAGGEPRRIDVLPASGGSAVPGWQADRGEVWDPRRGYGWQVPPGDASLPPLEPPAADPAATVRVLDDPAVFQWQLPPGVWRIQIGLGDVYPWGGSLIAIDGLGVVQVANQIEANARPTVTAEVTVTGAPVMIRFGDEPGRSLRAPRHGLVVPATIRRGAKSGWSKRVLGWIVDPGESRVAARIPAALQPLFSTGAAATGPLANLAVHLVDLVPPDGGPALPARVTSVGQRPVSLRGSLEGWDEQEVTSPNDGIARELELKPEGPTVGDRLLPRSAVTLRATLPLPAGTWALPPHLVERDRQGAWVTTTFGRKAVTAYPIGPAVLVTTGLRPGDALWSPRMRTQDDPVEDHPTSVSGALNGRVVAGASTVVVCPPTWGRVQELKPDGIEVVSGEQIMLLYNTWLDDRARERAEAQRRITEDADQAERERVARSEAAASARALERETEQTTRQALAEVTDPPPDERRAAMPVRRERAKAERERADVRASTRVLLGGDAQATAEAQARRARIAELRTQLDSANLDIPGWRSVTEARGAWADALANLGLRPAREAVAVAETRGDLLRGIARRASGSWELDVAADFMRLRRITAPASGRLQWLDGYNEMNRAMTKIGRDLTVWGGMPLAEIQDLSVLDLVVEVPERRYGSLALGQRLTVILPDRGDLRTTAAITVIGGVLAPPLDRRDNTGVLVANSRVATVRARLEGIAKIQPPLAPGLRALVVFPGDQP